MNVVSPEIRELQQQVAELRDRLSHFEGKIEQVNRTASDTSRQTIWQFVIFTVTMAGVLIGATIYQTEALRRETNARFDTVDKQFEALEKRLDQIEKNMTSRFDDLKQIVLSERKQTPQQPSSKNE